MDRVSLTGRLILICEDEPLIALDIANAFKRSGARVAVASSVRDAFAAVDDDLPSAAILDYVLSDGDTSPVCERLKERDIPFVLYTGFSNIHGACGEAMQLFKPARPEVLVSTVVSILQRQPTCHLKDAKEDLRPQQLTHELTRIDFLIEEGERRVAEHGRRMERLERDERHEDLSLKLRRNLEEGLNILRHHREIVRRELNSFSRQHQRKLQFP
jgi:DNA-binding response OmpR family regulator